MADAILVASNWRAISSTAASGIIHGLLVAGPRLRAPGRCPFSIQCRTVAVATPKSVAVSATLHHSCSFVIVIIVPPN